MKKAEWRHNITITSDHSKYYDVDWIFGFHQYEYESDPRMTPKIFIEALSGGMPSCTACHFQISGGMNSFMAFLTDSAQVTLVCCIVDKT